MVKAKLGKALAKKLNDFIEEMKDKYAMDPDQTRSALRNYVNEGYQPRDPKRVLPGDDEPLALIVTTNTILPNKKSEFMKDIFEQSVMDEVMGEARKEFDLFKLRQLDPKKMTKQADGGRVGMVKGGLLKGLASLFKSKGKEVAKAATTEGTVKSRIFTENIVKEFGEKEVKEVFRILEDRYNNPELEKMFTREGESKLDDLVNMLESRYTSSERLQYHPFSFNRRGAGAADRYTKINDSGMKLTDLPGGPGDKALYGKNFGEMSGTTNYNTGKPVYENPRPTVFDEGTILADKGQTIDVAPVKSGIDNLLDEARTKAKFTAIEADEATKSIEVYRRLVEDGYDPVEAAEIARKMLTRTKQAAGGRIGAKTGGLMAILKALGMRAPDKVADKKQIENVIRDPDTDLERLREIRDPDTGTIIRKGTPEDRMTIDEIRDMIATDPRYDKLTAAQMDLVVRREAIRADFSYNMGIRPEEVPEDLIDMLLMEGYDKRFGFNQGGGVETLFQRKAM